MEEREEFEEFEEDFDTENAEYQVWILGYDENYKITDFDKKLRSYSLAESAVKFAEKYVADGEYENETIPDNVKYLEVLVETVLDVEGYEENVGNLFDETVEIKKV